MESQLGRSPLDFVRVQRLMVTSMDLIEVENQPIFLKKIHKAILLIWRSLFLYPSLIFQNVAIFTAKTHEEAFRVPFVALTVTKIVFKGTMFLLKVQEIREMWQQLDDPLFRTKTIREMK